MTCLRWDGILCDQCVTQSLLSLRWKNLDNRSTFAEVMVKNTSVFFLITVAHSISHWWQGFYSALSRGPWCSALHTRKCGALLKAVCCMYRHASQQCFSFTVIFVRKFLITRRHEHQDALACTARYWYTTFVRPPVRPSVTFWYNTRHVVKRFTPSGRAIIVVF